LLWGIFSVAKLSFVQHVNVTSRTSRCPHFQQILNVTALFSPHRNTFV
jgi:hypothetical protein